MRNDMLERGLTASSAVLFIGAGHAEYGCAEERRVIELVCHI